jgi:spore coat polysaccharide biosynthesis protein SpsF
MGSEAVVEGDFARRSVVLRTRDGAEERLDFAHDINAMYVSEAEHFLTMVRGDRGTAAVEDDLRALELALAARDHGPVFSLPRQSPRLERIPVVIQARMGSTRLPGKVLMKTVGQTMFSLLVERLRRARRVDGIYVATSDKPADEQIVAEAERLGVPWFRGSENDVLSRYLGVARKFDLPAIVRITADCPLMDPDVLDSVIEKFTREQPDYCCNTIPRSVPNGLDVEVFSRATLERISRDAVDPLDREHVTRHIYRHPERFECLAAAPYDPQMAARRWTLDTPADYEFLSAVFEELYPHNPRFGTEEVLALLARRPELEANLRAAIGPHE